RTRRLIGAPRVPPPPRCAIRPRAPPARLRPRASAARDCECLQPPQVEGRAHEIPFPAHLRHAAEGEATKAHRLLISACRRKTCRTRAGRIAQRRGGGAGPAPAARPPRRPAAARGPAPPRRPRLPPPPSPLR